MQPQCSVYVHVGAACTWQGGGTDADVTAPKLKEERGGHWTEEQHLQMGALHEELPESAAAHGAERHWQRDEAEKALGHEHAERLLAEQVCGAPLPS